jgi:hypothetical protein
MNLNSNNTANNLINWYWSKYNDIPNLAGGNDGLCQCATESFIMRSGDPKTARSFLMIGALIDQIMFTDFYEIYDDFRDEFRYPKLHAHSGGGMASPSWLGYSHHGFNKKIDWDNVSEILDVLLLSTEKWFEDNMMHDKLSSFHESLILSINTEFEENTKERLMSLLNKR